MALISTTELVAQIPEIKTGTSDATLLALLSTIIDGIGAAFARACGYPPATASASPTMESASYVLYLTGNGTRDLPLPVWPVTAVSEVRDDPTQDWTDSAYLVSSADYAIVYDPDMGPILRLTSTATWGLWSANPGAIRVSLTAGYATAPHDLKACAYMAARAWHDARDTRGKVSRSSSGNSVSYTDEAFLTPHVLMGLARFMLPRSVIS